MNEHAGGWSTQQLAEFVAAVTTVADADVAMRSGVELVAEALDADAVALVSGEGVEYSVGWPAGAAPVGQIKAAAQLPLGARVSVAVPGLGDLPVSMVDVGEPGDTRLLVARAGGLLDAEEKGLLRAMARTLGLAVRNHEALSALRVRQRLLEGLSEIQRSIARRAPLQQVLDSVVTLAREIVGQDQTVLLLRDPDDSDVIAVRASTGGNGLFGQVQRMRVSEGVAGHAIRDGHLVVADPYYEYVHAVPKLIDAGLTVAMAAPVYEDGQAVGALAVSSCRPGRRYSATDRSMLSTMAQHVSLALTDARIVSDMLHQALHDPLTGMPNRVLFGDRLAHALKRAERSTAEVGVVFVDLDRFKPVNDSLGHAAGDAVLRVVAERIASCVRHGDTAARLGGDEFGVLLEDRPSSEDAINVAQRIIDALAAPVLLGGREVFIGASIGVATGRRGAEDLLRKADVAMYRAKAEGKGRLVLYEDSMQVEVLERLELEADLRHALDRGELELFYQPIVDLASGSLHGVEALIRWRHPERGMVGPCAFIPIAEETGMIVEIGRWVLDTAARQLADWHAAGAPRGLTMNVNLSSRQLEDPVLRDVVAEAVALPGIGPGRLVLEITETVLLHDTETTIDRLRELRALGILLAVDDFGTGYSSLRYLSRFPVDILKMALPFVERIDEGAGLRALAQTIVDLGTNLGLRVIAEGIERAAQVTELRALGCELGQGYHFGVPAPAAELESLILGSQAARRGSAAVVGSGVAEPK